MVYAGGKSKRIKGRSGSLWLLEAIIAHNLWFLLCRAFISMFIPLRIDPTEKDSENARMLKLSLHTSKL